MRRDLTIRLDKLINYNPRNNNLVYHELISDSSSSLEAIKSDIITSFYSFILTHDKKNLMEALKNAKYSKHSFSEDFRTDEVIYDKKYRVNIYCNFKFLYDKKSLELRFAVVDGCNKKHWISRSKPGLDRYHALYHNLVELEDAYTTL